MKKVHFISIGGAVMHNLAMCLQQLNWEVTGSDDEIFEPSKSRLAAARLLPEKQGWNPEIITTDLDAVILGMHARADNPELIKAQALGLKIYSFPEFVFEHAKNKIRLVIGGSHGKTTTTAMIMHILKEQNKQFDYLVGSIIDGYDTMVQLSDAPIIIIEGDEYLNSALDPRPKFHFYYPQLAQITGIAWDHINVFPTWESYVEQFRIFISQLPDNAPLAYFEEDLTLKTLCVAESDRLNLLPYSTPKYLIENEKTFLVYEGEKFPLRIFGTHNLQNLEGAVKLCETLGISRKEAYRSMENFGGTARRLEAWLDTTDRKVYRDFAHSPSKLEATVKSVKEQYPKRKIIAVFELHTFSSLTKSFLEEYHNCLAGADDALVYFNPEVLIHKRLPEIDPEEVSEAFGGSVKVYTDSEMLAEYLKAQNYANTVMLLMSSGTFNNLDFRFIKDV